MSIVREALGLPTTYCKRDNGVLDRYRTERQACVDFVGRTLEQVQTANRDLSDTERESLAAQRTRIEQLDAMIEPLEQFEALRGADQRGAAPFVPAAPANPAAGGSGQSYGAGANVQPRAHEYASRGAVIVDIVAARGFSSNSEQVSDQVQAAARERLMAARVPAKFIAGAPDTYTRAVANEITTDVPGLLPKPIVGPVNNDIDAARPFITSIGARDLGQIPGKVFTRPLVTQHVAVGKQATEKSELASQKYTVGGVDFTKETWGGTIDVSRQVMDWSSPGAWDALLEDLQAVYAIQTEAAAVTAFSTAVTQATAAVGSNDLKGWAAGLYAAASLVYAGAKRLPDVIYSSLDMWAQMGAIVDSSRLAMRGDTDKARALGNSGVTSFEGNVFDLPRVIVPSLPNGTVIVGVRSKTEFYEERIGFLTAVEPRLLGVELAYGGYAAYGTLVPNGFAKVTKPA